METKDKSGKLLFTVNDVFSSDGYLKGKGKTHYNIPHYQRGYKWEPHNVEKLLNDVNNFEIGEGKFYCLQNITIVSCDDYFNVIDGQQRLATLTIILSILSQKALVASKVRFPENSIRKYTNQFLREFVTNPDNTFPDVDWESFAGNNRHYDLQDIGHIFEVYRSVERWLLEKEGEKSPFDRIKFLDKLQNDVRLIINEVDGQTSEEKVFGNLNSKRVPLDGSDLVRAILITRVAREEAKKESDLKNIIYVNERRVKLGWELDQINNWWGIESVKGYFSAFISIKSEQVGGENKLFNEQFYPINLLYLLFAESKGEEVLKLDLIEKHSNSTIALYKEIHRVHYTVQDWFSDKIIYHYLGFLFNVRTKNKKTFHEIWKLWEQSLTRSDFLKKIKQIIFSYFEDEGELIDYKNLAKNWYDDQQSELLNTLILMDVIHAVNENQPNLPYNRFTKNSDDVEHIFPRNPQEVKNKKAYIEFLNKFCGDSGIAFELSDFNQRKNDENYIKAVDEHIASVTENIAINSIGNLVLLYRKLNQSISNSNFAVKRSRIIDYHSSGAFIQPHTFKVFTRNFNDLQNVNRDYEYWTNDDIIRNCEYIELELRNFFNDL